MPASVRVCQPDGVEHCHCAHFSDAHTIASGDPGDERPVLNSHNSRSLGHGVFAWWFSLLLMLAAFRFSLGKKVFVVPSLSRMHFRPRWIALTPLLLSTVLGQITLNGNEMKVLLNKVAEDTLEISKIQVKYFFRVDSFSVDSFMHVLSSFGDFSPLPCMLAPLWLVTPPMDVTPDLNCYSLACYPHGCNPPDVADMSPSLFPQYTAIVAATYLGLWGQISGFRILCVKTFGETFSFGNVSD